MDNFSCTNMIQESIGDDIAANIEKKPFIISINDNHYE